MSNEIYAGSARAGDGVVLVDEPAPLISPLAAKLGAEFLGTFWLVLAGVSLALFSSAGIPSALGFGLAFVTGAYALAHISGAHFNPAVTLGTAIAGKTPWRDVLPYIISQVVGGALATLAIFVIIKQHPNVKETRTAFASVSNVWKDGANPSFGFAAALIVEFIVAAVFLAVVLGSTDKRASKGFAPVAIGLAYALAIQIAAPITGGSVNPARSAATAIFATGAAAGQLWLFWLAPLLGAAFAGFIYKAFQAPAGTSFTVMIEDVVDDSELDDQAQGQVPGRDLDGAPLGFGAAIRSAFRNYATFHGRASRSAYWWFALLTSLVELPFSVWYMVAFIGSVATADYANSSAPPSFPVGVLVPMLFLSLVSLPLLLPSLGLAVRRLHDCNRSGWYYFMAFIPFVGSLILLIFYLQEGTPGPNQYSLSSGFGGQQPQAPWR